MGIGTPAVRSPLSPYRSPMKTALRSLLAPFALLVATLTLSAQVNFTITATADSTELGYTLGQTYTFVYTLSGTVADSGTGNHSPGASSWDEQLFVHSQLFTAVDGTGMGGDFVRPADPSSYLWVNTAGTLSVSVAADTGYGTGLTTLGGTAVQAANFSLQVPAANFLAPGFFVNPADMFAGSAGTYAITSGAVYVYTAGYLNEVFFTASSLTISAAAIPEPSTYAALLGLGALGVAAWRRQKRKLTERCAEMAKQT